MLTPEEITRHHEWEPSDGEQARVGPRSDEGPVAIVAYDPTWPASYSLVAERIQLALGDRVLDIDHVGSTSVPGLPAKAVIDVDLVVADSADEQAYVDALATVGFRLRVRERGWHEHRMLVANEPRTHLHVFSPDCPEVVRHRMFRDWLRTHPDELVAYRDAKFESAAGATAAGEDSMGYNLRKQPAIREIYDRMFRAHGLI